MSITRRLTAPLTVGAAVLAASIIGISGPAQAAGSGVDLYLNPQYLSWNDGDTASIVMNIENEGTVKTPGAVWLKFKYGLPVQPAAPTDVRYDNMRLASGPAGTHCTNHPTTRIINCTTPAIRAGRAAVITFNARANLDGGTTVESGSYYAEVGTTVTDDYWANNVSQGGFAIYPAAR